MDAAGLLREIRALPGSAERIVHVRVLPARPARYASPAAPLPAPLRRALARQGVERLWSHQAMALDLVREGRDAVLSTGPASGKTLAYTLPLLEILAREPDARALLLFPTKALTQDQHRAFREACGACGLGSVESGVYDGDTPGPARRRLRDRGAALFTNPDMLHAALLPEHPRWSAFLSRLRLIVVDEIHEMSGIFGANAANLFRRLLRVCAHHGASPTVVACSATIANPREHAERLLGRPMALVSEDGSPRGRRTFVFWNPPRVRDTARRSRRSANVEAHEIMARLVSAGVPTITFSKARVTAELIHRYVRETLEATAPDLARRVSPYRGGYLPEERREIERRLFAGELLGVSTTRALELGIDVGGLSACVVVGWPGTLASFLQQAGRAGRREGDALVVLVGLDTPANQYVLRHPEYVFGRPVEEAVAEPGNPYVLTGHLRCAAHELPLDERELDGFGRHAGLVLRVLAGNAKVHRIGERWFHAASEVPQHEISLRDATDRNVVIEDEATGRLLGEVGKLDAPTMLHPEAVYLHRGETYRVLALDLERSVATVRREDLDYYTQALGGDDVHHVDRVLREKPFGTGEACWGEVTAIAGVHSYERIRFYTLDAVSRHRVHLPYVTVETMAFWVTPPDPLMAEVTRLGHSPVAGLRGIGFALRMLLPLFVTIETLDLSHTVGAANAPWQAIIVWEHYPRGLGFTERGFDLLHRVLPAVRDLVRGCPCADGCPLCVGKPLRPYTVTNPERGEGSIPSKAAALAILDGLLGDGSALRAPDRGALTDSEEALELRLAQALRRRLERHREPETIHAIAPRPPRGYPEPETALERPDVAVRGERRRELMRRLRRRAGARGAGGDR